MQSWVKPSTLKEILILLSHHRCILPPSIFFSFQINNPSKIPFSRTAKKKRKIQNDPGLKNIYIVKRWRRKSEWWFLSDKCLELSSRLERMENVQTRHLCFFITEKSSIHYHLLKNRETRIMIDMKNGGMWLAGSRPLFFLYIGERTRVRVFLPFSAEITVRPAIRVWQVGERTFSFFRLVQLFRC